MTDKESKELNERLALRCRFISYDNYWAFPDATTHDNLPSFTTDPAACLKWIMPVLREAGLYEVCFKYKGDSIECYLGIGNLPVMFKSIAETESLAFCLAADKFLSEVK
jgi:hypothetical protein